MLNSEFAIAEEPGRPLWQWCVASFLLVALLGSAIDAIELYLTNRFGWHSSFWFRSKVELSVGSALGVIVFAPVGETLLLAWTVGLLKSAGLTVWRIVAYSAIGWGAFHGLWGLSWALPAAAAFAVLTYTYIAWRSVSLWHAMAAALVPHVMNNAASYYLTPNTWPS